MNKYHCLLIDFFYEENDPKGNELISPKIYIKIKTGIHAFQEKFQVEVIIIEN